MWKKLFQREFDRINTPLVLVRHSLGGSILLKYLSEEKPKIAVSALFLISTPLWGKYGWDVDDFVLPDNFENVAPGIKHIYLYHCKEDNIVPFSHLNFYKSAFPNAVVRILEGNDHAFVNGLPELVDDIKALNGMTIAKKVQDQ